MPKEIEALFAHAPPGDAFASIEASLSLCPEATENRERDLALDSVETVAKNLPLAFDWAAAVFTASPAYLRKEQGPMASTRLFEDRLCNLVIAALKPASSTERAALIAALLPDLGDISLLCALLHKGGGDQSPEDLFGTMTAELKGRLCACATRGHVAEIPKRYQPLGSSSAIAAPGGVVAPFPQ